MNPTLWPFLFFCLLQDEEHLREAIRMIEGYQAQNQQVGGLAQGLQVACRVQCLQQAQVPCPVAALASRPPSMLSFTCSYLVQDPRGPYWRFLRCTLSPSLQVAARLALKLDASAREVAAVDGVPRPPPLSPLPFANGEVGMHKGKPLLFPCLNFATRSVGEKLQLLTSASMQHRASSSHSLCAG